MWAAEILRFLCRVLVRDSDWVSRENLTVNSVRLWAQDVDPHPVAVLGQVVLSLSAVVLRSWTRKCCWDVTGLQASG